MIEIELLDGGADELVRGFAACLASVTELDAAEVPVGGSPSSGPRPRRVARWPSWRSGRRRESS